MAWAANIRSNGSRCGEENCPARTAESGYTGRNFANSWPTSARSGVTKGLVPVLRNRGGMAQLVVQLGKAFDRYFLAVYFAYLLVLHVPLWQKLLERPLTWEFWSAHPVLVLASFIQLSDASINLLFLYRIYLRREALVPADNVLEVLVPISSLALTYLGWSWLRTSPPLDNPARLVLSLSLQLLSSALVISALMAFSDRFGFNVEVRGLVQNGIYRWLRHPIYTGYMINFCSVTILRPQPAVFAWAALCAGLLIWRSKLEEQKLTAAIAEYSDYQKGTWW